MILRNKSAVVKKVLLIAGFLLVIISGAVVLADFYIKKKTKKYIYSSIDNLPYNRVGLLLGTSKTTRSGRSNWYFKNRISAAKSLLDNHKVEFLIISGDNGHNYYNEPRDMKNALIEEGVDSTKIFLDFAGFRTYDSVVRAKKVFGQSEVTVISQRFHNQRALFIAQRIGLKAVAFNARDVRVSGGLKTRVREKFARVLAIFDVMFNAEPKYLGKTIIIE